MQYAGILKDHYYFNYTRTSYSYYFTIPMLRCFGVLSEAIVAKIITLIAEVGKTRNK